MTSQIEWLRESISRLESKGGPESPFLKGLRTQLAGLESQAGRASEREEFNLAVTSSRNLAEEPEEQAAANLYEQRISELQSATVLQQTEQQPSPESTIPSNLGEVLQAVSTALGSPEQSQSESPVAGIADLASAFTSTLTKEPESAQKQESASPSTE